MSADREFEEGLLEALDHIKRLQKKQRSVRMTRDELHRALRPVVLVLYSDEEFSVSKCLRGIGYGGRAKPRHVKALHAALSKLLVEEER